MWKALTKKWYWQRGTVDGYRNMVINGYWIHRPLTMQLGNLVVKCPHYKPKALGSKPGQATIFSSHYAVVCFA